MPTDVKFEPQRNCGPALNGFGSLSLQTLANAKESENCNFIRTALSNYLVVDIFDNMQCSSIMLIMIMCAFETDSFPLYTKVIFPVTVRKSLVFQVLKRIFSFLNNRDLDACCHVHEDWRAVADPLVLSYFEVNLDKQNAESYSPVLIHVREWDRHKYNSFNDWDYYYYNYLEEVVLTRKVYIRLRVSKFVDVRKDRVDEEMFSDGPHYVVMQGKEVMDFLSKIGPHVVDLDLSEIDELPMKFADFCKLLLQKFPNLKKLNSCGFRPNEDDDDLEDQLFDPDLPQNKHKRLRKIVFGNKRLTLSFVETMLKMSENLEKIEDFPLRYINAIVVAQKGPALNTLLDVRYTDSDLPDVGETVVTAYEQLALVEPKLTSLVFRSDRFDSEDTYELVKPSVLSVLHSSHESLKSLVISPSRPYKKAQNFPILKGLKDLQLVRCNNRKDRDFFLPGMPVMEIFPIVSKITLVRFSKHKGRNLDEPFMEILPTFSKIICKWHWDEVFINRHLAKKAISIWGAQINELSVLAIHAGCMTMVQRLFPSVQKLRINIIEINIGKTLLEFSRGWPQLKSLTIFVHEICRKKDWIQGRILRLDHALTGLPEQVIDQLEDPSRRKDFTEEQIQGFKDRSIISKLKELRELKLFMYKSCSNPERKCSTYMRLTPVANEFGFKLLPELKVTVGILEVEKFAEEIKTDLEALAPCSNIEIGHVYPCSYCEW